MRGLDDTDRNILRLLLEDGRRPYSEIAEQVDLSAPAVSDRVDGLRERGLIRRFTVDVDRSKLREGVPVLVRIHATPGSSQPHATALRDADAVEHVFRTAEDHVILTATVADGAVDELLATHTDLEEVQTYDVCLLADREWSPSLGDAEFAPACAECGNTVTAEGESERLGGEAYYFCCQSCRQNFVEQYEALSEAAES